MANAELKTVVGQRLSSELTFAMGLMILAMAIIPLMDVLSKILSNDHAMSPVMITWVRFAGQALLLLLYIWLRLGPSALASRYVYINLMRGMLVGSAVSLFFIAIKYLPLADAIAIFFVEPMVVLLLSAIFLKEKVGWRRVSVSLVGFAGALLIIQPTYEAFGPVVFLPLGTACLFAIYLLLSSKIGRDESPLTMQFWSGIGGVLICSVFLAVGSFSQMEDFAITVPTSGTAVALLAGVVIIATIGHLMIVTAFSKADASVLAPFQYLEIVTMTAAGYFVFGQFPDASKWLGIAIIVSSGLYIFFRERSLNSQE